MKLISYHPIVDLLATLCPANSWLSKHLYKMDDILLRYDHIVSVVGFQMNNDRLLLVGGLCLSIILFLTFGGGIYFG